MNIKIVLLTFGFMLSCVGNPWASSDVVHDPDYWIKDIEYTQAIKEQGEKVVFEQIRKSLQSGATQLKSGSWEPSFEEAHELAQAMRWAVIARMVDQIDVLDSMVDAPRGELLIQWHYSLTYNGQWAAWLLQTQDYSDEQRFAAIMSMWHGENVSYQDRSFARDRLIEDDSLTDALLKLAEELLSQAGEVQEGILNIEDSVAAQKYTEVEHVLRIKASVDQKTKKKIQQYAANSPIGELLFLD